MKKIIVLAAIVVAYKKLKSKLQGAAITLAVTDAYHDDLTEKLERYGFQKMPLTWLCDVTDCGYRLYSNDQTSLEAQRQKHVEEKHTLSS